MAELTPEMQAAGIFLDANGIPTLPDGSPALRQNQPPSDIPRGDTSAPLLAEIARQASNIGGSFGGRGEGPSGEPLPDTQTVGGFPYAQDPVGYGFGPPYGASPTEYQDTRRGPPLAPPLWNMGMEGPAPEGAFIQDKPDDWKRFYTPNDISTGGGFFFAADAFPNGVPPVFQQGATARSTNNWRLIPGGHPGMVMRNGRIIDTNRPDVRRVMGIQNLFYQSGVASGFPSAIGPGTIPEFNYSAVGWPGNDQWVTLGYYNQ